MGKILVVYQSKYGSAKKYAQWIAKALECGLSERKKINLKQLEEYDLVIFGGGLYAGGVSGIDLLAKGFKRFPHAKWVLFTCGLADPNDPENISHIRNGLKRVLTPEMQKQITMFHFRGGIDYPRLSTVHKAMMTMLFSSLRKRDPAGLREEDRQMIATYGKAVDFTDRKMILPLVEWVREEQKKKGDSTCR